LTRRTPASPSDPTRNKRPNLTTDTPSHWTTVPSSAISYSAVMSVLTCRLSRRCRRVPPSPAFYTWPMPPKPRSAGYFDGWYADQATTLAVAEIMNRHMGFPPDTRAGVVVAEAIPKLAEELRLRPGSTLLDLACGRGAYGLLIAQEAGASLIGVDFSAQALAEAREQAVRMGVSNASFRIGALTATGLPDASVEAVLCTDAIQFPDEPADAYDEIQRVLKPGGRLVLTCWEPLDCDDERLSLRVRRANLGVGLRQAGFTGVEVRDRPSWLAREHALWEEVVTLDPSDDPALRSLHAEGVKSLQWPALLRRVLAVATKPQ
jgi:SAM-dependent methyltransferase